ncbi:hypothetical protein EBV26_17705, partial [bacterium]|nr:hypothetical protein [bacterium]
MKLNELVRLRNQLSNALEITALNIELEKNYSRLINLTLDIDEEIAVGISDLAHNHKNISA